MHLAGYHYLTALSPGDVLMLSEQLSSSPITAQEIKTMTSKDPVLSKVLQFVLYGWPISAVSEELRPYYRRREELSHFKGCVLWDPRVVVPPQPKKQFSRYSMRVIQEAL